MTDPAPGKARSLPVKDTAGQGAGAVKPAGDKSAGGRPGGGKPGAGQGGGRPPGAAPQVVVRPMAGRAQLRHRHRGLLLLLLFLVLVPSGATGLYLYLKAADQYASTLGFTVRSEAISSASDLMGGLSTAFGSSGSHNSDILYEYVGSQEMVAALDARLDLRAMYSRYHDSDPLLGFDPRGTIEDLTRYWNYMLKVSYDGGSGLMELRILAFAPQDAQKIAEAVFDESARMINALSASARTDAMRYATQDLDDAVERLKQAREALTQFRLKNRIVDPSADIQGQMGLLNTLQAQLASALIDLDLLSGSAREGDPRLAQAQRRIDVIQGRIDEERRKFGAEGVGPGGENYATTVSDYERLTVDREFAERAYSAALLAYDAARAKADRESLYLAAYIRPTIAEQSEYPQRALWTGLVALFGFLVWAIFSLVYYSLRDRH